MANLKKKPSVLHIIGNSKFGGGTMMVFSLVEMAQCHGWKATILSDDPITVATCHKLGIEVLEFRGIIRPIRPWTDIYTVRRLARLLRQRADTIVHTHTLKGGLVGRWAAHKAGVPIIIHHNHGWSFKDSSVIRKYIIGMLEKHGAQLCDHIISVNQSDIDWAVKKGFGAISKFSCIPNGLNREEIDSIKPITHSVLINMLGVESNSVLITIIARLFSEKGHLWMFDAMKKISSDEGQPVHLVLLGDGPHKDLYTRQVSKLGITDRVHFMGHRTDCRAIAKACDLFVLPSLREGHSITILEAMALELPIVATDIRGINNSVRHEQEALLVPVCNSNALSEAINRLINDRQLMRGLKHAARQRFLAEFTEERMLVHTYRVYYTLLKAKGLL